MDTLGYIGKNAICLSNDFRSIVVLFCFCAVVGCAFSIGFRLFK